MRFAPLLLVLTALPGCVASRSIAPGAEPFAADAFESREALERYLEASGVQVTSAYDLPGVNMPYLEHAFRLEFGRFTCAFYVYESAEAARQYGPGLGTYTVSRSASTMEPGRNISYSRRRSAPVITFGANVTPCTPLYIPAVPALQALETYGEASGIEAGIAQEDEKVQESQASARG